MKRTVSVTLGKTALLLGLFFLNGCSLKDSKPMTEYSLMTPDIAAVTSSRFRTKTIKVTYPVGLKEKLSREMNFSYSLNDRGSYQNSQWSNGVAQLLQGTIIEALDQSRAFGGVLSYNSTAYADYRLESSVYDFSHHVRGEASYAVVSIKFTLIDTSTGKMVRIKKFSYREPTSTVDARGYVEATNRIMAKLTRDLIKWLR